MTSAVMPLCARIQGVNSKRLRVSFHLTLDLKFCKHVHRRVLSGKSALATSITSSRVLGVSIAFMLSPWCHRPPLFAAHAQSGIAAPFPGRAFPNGPKQEMSGCRLRFYAKLALTTLLSRS